jgi:hypothetical protein
MLTPLRTEVRAAVLGTQADLGVNWLLNMRRLGVVNILVGVVGETATRVALGHGAACWDLYMDVGGAEADAPLASRATFGRAVMVEQLTAFGLDVAVSAVDVYWFSDPRLLFHPEVRAVSWTDRHRQTGLTRKTQTDGTLSDVQRRSSCLETMRTLTELGLI